MPDWLLWLLLFRARDPLPGDIVLRCSPDSFEAASNDGWWYEEVQPDGSTTMCADQHAARLAYESRQRASLWGTL